MFELENLGSSKRYLSLVRRLSTELDVSWSLLLIKPKFGIEVRGEMFTSAPESSKYMSNEVKFIKRILCFTTLHRDVCL